MLGYLVGGFLRLLLRVWTFGLFHFLENRLFLWIKGIATPRLQYKNISPCGNEISPRNQYNRMDSKLCLLNTSQNSWNSILFSSLSSSKKLPFIWLAKTRMLPSTLTEQTFLPKSYGTDFSTQEYWNLRSVTEAAIVRDKNLKTDAMFKDNCSLIPREIIPSCFELKQQDMGLPEQCIFKDLYHDFLQKEKEKMDLLKQDYSSAVCEKHCSSAASIDSGYQSFPSVESAYTCIEEEGITLYVSDCRYDKDGKLIRMTVGFGITEDSTTSDSLGFDNVLSDESDSECESSDELEEDFIIFDADSCEDADTFSLDGFVFEGTADEISVAMSMNTYCHQTLEIRIAQTLPDPHLYYCDVKDNFDQEQDDNTEIKTNRTNTSAGTVQKKKKVHFQEDKIEIHKIIAWDFAYRQARIGHWKNYAIDRMQFQRRIDQTAKIIEPILHKKISQINI